MRQQKGLTFVLASLLVTVIICLIPTAQAKVTVHSVTVSTDKTTYTIGSEAIAMGVLDYTGSKKDLLGVNFTWYYPNGTLAKFDPNIMPYGSGTAYSSFWPDTLGNNYIVNATYSGDVTIFDETSFDVVESSPGNEVGGPINSDETWTLAGSPYIVVEDVFVEQGVTLTIEPGVVVEFKSHKCLRVNGTLIAIGDEMNMITFTSNNSNPQPGDWEGIDFIDAGADSVLSYCRIEYSFLHAIYIFNSSPEITYNLIRDVNRTGIIAEKSSSYIAYNTITEISHDLASNKGIYLQGDCDTTIYGNAISDVQEYGIKITNSNPMISENYISGSYYNIDCQDSEATITNNTLFDASIAGIRLMDCNNVMIVNNSIFDNARKGIECIRSSPKIFNNHISHNGDSGIDEAGIYFFMSENVEILNNILEGNRYGLYAKDLSDSIISQNKFYNCTKDGIYVKDSYKLDILENIIMWGENGVHLIDSRDFILIANTVSDSTEKALFIYNITDFSIVQNILTSNKYGTYMHSSTGTMTNSTILNGIERDIYLIQNSKLLSINSTFGKEKVQVSGGCEFIVMNYLHVFVQNESYMPFQETDVTIKDNEKVVYSTQTDSEGLCRFLLLTDRIYHGSNTPTENITNVEVENGSVYLLNNPREVDMSYSHTEVFCPGNPLSISINNPRHASLVFDSLNITGTAFSMGGEIVKVEVNVDTGEWLSATQINGQWSQWKFELDTRGLFDGPHIISARVSTLYHKKEVYVQVLVDNIGNKPPLVNITSHNSSDAVKNTTTLEGTSFDYDGDVVSVEVRIDNGSWITANNPEGDWSKWSIEINTRNYTNGEHNITVMVIDNATEATAIDIVLIFDNEDTDEIDDGEDGGEGDGADSGFGLERIPWKICIIWIVVIFIILMAFFKNVRDKKKRKKK
ncbi:MAG: right-handed parallel beta-helix repeat-containing protein [Thermoplasmata archaeon]|nr:MAG: right-handed parallel beta-helix repeat-containing protein [Thermoplasmata archaeon]